MIPILYYIKMVNENIIKYYLLCSTALAKRGHIINQIPNDKLNLIINTKEVNVYLRKRDNEYIIREHVIGGGDDIALPSRGKITIV